MIQEKPIFREAKTDEADLVNDFIFNKFGSEELQLFQQFSFWIKEGKVKEVFLLKKNIESIVKKLPTQVYSTGIPIGSIWKNKFQLEIEGSSLLSSITSKKIQVKTDQFLYGKHIFVENIESSASDFDKEDIIIIIGKNALHYGVGKAEIGSNEIHNAPVNTILIKGSPDKPLDRGWYLRRGK